MSRKRKPENNPSLLPALNKLTTMELSAIYRAVTREYTCEDVLRWMWPDEIITTLKNAFDFAEKEYWPYKNRRMIEGNTVEVEVNTHTHHMCVPKKDLEHDNVNENINKDVNEIVRITAQYKVVHGVINWLNNHASVAAARHYFPALCSLLPAEHMIHNINSHRYREPDSDISTIANSIREATTTVAMGLLCGEKEPPEGKFFGVIVGTTKYYLL